MEWRYGIGSGADLAHVEGIAGQTREAGMLAHDASPDALASVVREHRRPASQHIDPFREEQELALLVLLSCRRIGRGSDLEALPGSRKDPRCREEGLPVIEDRPCEAWDRRHRGHGRPHCQRRRRHGARAGGGRSRSMRWWSRSVPAATACAIVGKLSEDSSRISPPESTMRQRQAEVREVAKANTFTRLSCPAGRGPTRPTGPGRRPGASPPGCG